MAIKTGNITEAIRLLSGGYVNVNERDEISGLTALHYAAINGFVPVLKILLQNDAVVDVRNSENSTPLHLASSLGHLDVIKLLLDSGAVVNARDNRNMTPLHRAALDTPRDSQIDVITLLLDNDADIDAVDHLNRTSLFISVEHADVNATKLFVTRGADMDVRNIDGLSPADVAKQANFTEIVDLITGEF